MVAKKQFVIQFRLDSQPTGELHDWIVRVEDALDGALQRQRLGTVDGHDIGSGTINIFFYAKSFAQGDCC